jgi:hypothetical protein
MNQVGDKRQVGKMGEGKRETGGESLGAGSGVRLDKQANASQPINQVGDGGWT